MIPQGHIPPDAPPGAREIAGIDVRAILWAAAAIALVLIALVAILFLMYRGLEQKYPDRTSEAAARVGPADLPPLPRLQTAPLADLKAVRAAEDLHLTHYGWVDRQHAVAQIPIDRAMALWVSTYPVTAAAEPTPVLTNDGASTNNTTPPSQGPPTTELQMRRQKAQESPHVP